MSATKIYTAVYGDYLAKIAHEHGTTVGAIWNHPNNAAHRANRGSPDILYPGDVLHIPIPTPLPPPAPPEVPPPPPLQVPPAPPPAPPVIDFPPRPKVPPWNRRSVSRRKAKEGSSDQPIEVPRKHVPTDILVVGDLARQMIEDGWLISYPDIGYISLVPAPDATSKAYREHYENAYEFYAGSNTSKKALKPHITPERVYVLHIDQTLYNEGAPPTSVDPFRLNAIVALAREGRIDIVRTPWPLFREVREAQKGAIKASAPSVDWNKVAHPNRLVEGTTYTGTGSALERRRRILDVYGGKDAKLLDESGHPDESRDVVYVLSHNLTRGDPAQRKIGHELLGHLYLYRRACVDAHIVLPNREEERSKANVGPGKPGNSPRDPHGSTFLGIAAETHYIDRYNPDGTVDTTSNAIPGFVELYADNGSQVSAPDGQGGATEGIEFVMDPTYDVGELTRSLPSEKGGGHPIALAGRTVFGICVLGFAALSGSSGTSSVDANAGVMTLSYEGNDYPFDLVSLINSLNNSYLCLMRADYNERVFTGGGSGTVVGGMAKQLREVVHEILALMDKGLRASMLEVASKMYYGSLRLKVRGDGLPRVFARGGRDTMSEVLSKPGDKLETLLERWRRGRLLDDSPGDG